MSRRGASNILALCALALLVSVVTRALRTSTSQQGARDIFAEVRAPIDRVTLADGREGLVDVRGRVVPIAPYTRIITASTLSSEFAHALIEPTRIVGYSAYAADHPHAGWRYAGKAHIARVEDIEDILTLQPDLFVYHADASASAIARLQERGVQVFDLGPMLGVESYLKQAQQLLTLVGNAERFAPFAYDFERRRQTLQCRTMEPPVEALYVGMYGASLFGGTRGTAYHDVLRMAGLVDVAALAYEGWPEYAPEDLLALDPAWIVAPAGTRDVLCSHGALRTLDACADGGARVIELPGALVGDAGSAMLRAASMLHDAVYGPCVDAR